MKNLLLALVASFALLACGDKAVEKAKDATTTATDAKVSDAKATLTDTAIKTDVVVVDTSVKGDTSKDK
jgi:hypothetical protein